MSEVTLKRTRSPSSTAISAMPPTGSPLRITIVVSAGLAGFWELPPPGAVPSVFAPVLSPLLDELPSPSFLRTRRRITAAATAAIPARTRAVFDCISKLLCSASSGERAIQNRLESERRGTRRKPEGDQQTAGGSERARRLRAAAAGRGDASAAAGRDPLGEPQDRLATRVMTEQERSEEGEQRQRRDKDLGHRSCNPTAPPSE